MIRERCESAQKGVGFVRENVNARIHGPGAYESKEGLLKKEVGKAD